jgi:PilZ domain-containing protein
MIEIERRKTRRFSMSLPVSLMDESGKGQIRGLTRDVSSSGVSLFSAIELPVGTIVTLNLDWPGEITLTAPVRARCKGHIVRLESQPDGRSFGVAVRLDKFEFCRI